MMLWYKVRRNSCWLISKVTDAETLIVFVCFCCISGDIQELFETNIKPGHAAAFSDDCDSASAKGFVRGAGNQVVYLHPDSLTEQCQRQAFQPVGVIKNCVLFHPNRITTSGSLTLRRRPSRSWAWEPTHAPSTRESLWQTWLSGGTRTLRSSWSTGWSSTRSRRRPLLISRLVGLLKMRVETCSVTYFEKLYQRFLALCREDLYSKNLAESVTSPPLLIVFYKRHSTIDPMWHVRHLGKSSPVADAKSASHHRLKSMLGKRGIPWKWLGRQNRWLLILSKWANQISEPVRNCTRSLYWQHLTFVELQPAPVSKDACGLIITAA